MVYFVLKIQPNRARLNVDGLGTEFVLLIVMGREASEMDATKYKNI